VHNAQLDVSILTASLVQLRIPLSSERKAAELAAVALSATFAAVSALASRAGMLDEDGDGALLHAFAAAGTAEALASTLRVCMSVASALSGVIDAAISDALERGLAAVANVTVDGATSARFIGAGGIDVLVSVLTASEGGVGFSDVAVAEATSALCNVAVGHAAILIAAGTIQAVISAFRRAMVRDDDGAFAAVLAEPVCWTLRLLTRDLAWRVDPSTVSEALEIASLLQDVIDVAPAWPAAGKDTGGHAQAALVLIQQRIEGATGGLRKPGTVQVGIARLAWKASDDVLDATVTPLPTTSSTREASERRSPDSHSHESVAFRPLQALIPKHTS